MAHSSAKLDEEPKCVQFLICGGTRCDDHGLDGLGKKLLTKQFIMVEPLIDPPFNETIFDKFIDLGLDDGATHSYKITTSMYSLDEDPTFTLKVRPPLFPDELFSSQKRGIETTLQSQLAGIDALIFVVDTSDPKTFEALSSIVIDGQCQHLDAASSTSQMMRYVLALSHPPGLLPQRVDEEDLKYLATNLEAHYISAPLQYHNGPLATTQIAILWHIFGERRKVGGGVDGGTTTRPRTKSGSVGGQNDGSALEVDSVHKPGKVKVLIAGEPSETKDSKQDTTMPNIGEPSLARLFHISSGYPDDALVTNPGLGQRARRYHITAGTANDKGIPVHLDMSEPLSIKELFRCPTSASLKLKLLSTDILVLVVHMSDIASYRYLRENDLAQKVEALQKSSEGLKLVKVLMGVRQEYTSAIVVEEAPHLTNSQTVGDSEMETLAAELGCRYISVLAQDKHEMRQVLESLVAEVLFMKGTYPQRAGLGWKSRVSIRGRKAMERIRQIIQEAKHSGDTV